MAGAYSFSKLNTFETCPRQYQAKYITKEVVFKKTEASVWGDEVHKAAELNINEGKTLTPRFSLLEPYIAKLKATPGSLLAEVQLGMDENLNPIDYWDKSCWLRGKLDVLLDQGDRSIIWDWKTGKVKKNDSGELRCFSTLVFANQPEVKKTKNVYVWLNGDSEPTSEIVKRSQLEDLVEPIRHTVHMIERAEASGDFIPKRSGLCAKYCDVLACPHNGRR